MRIVCTWIDLETGEEGFKLFKKRYGVHGWLQHKQIAHKVLSVHFFETVSQSVVKNTPDGFQLIKVWRK